MRQSLYDHPDAYDALTGIPNGAVEFALERAPAAESALVVGCATGEHVRGLAAAGLDVVGVDSSPAMIEHARERTAEATFRVGALPDIPIERQFDLVVAPRAVINDLPAGRLQAALAALADRVGEDGVLILETGELPETGTLTLQTASGAEGEYARLYQFTHAGDRQVRMDALVFCDESWFVDRRMLTEFADEEIGVALTDLGFVVKREDDHTDRSVMVDPSVFVARR